MKYRMDCEVMGGHCSRFITQRLTEVTDDRKLSQKIDGLRHIQQNYKREEETCCQPRSHTHALNLVIMQLNN